LEDTVAADLRELKNATPGIFTGGNGENREEET
jgi:hypothetical protein